MNIEERAFIAASSHVLTEQFPDNVKAWDEEAINALLASHLPCLKILSLRDNMDLEDVEDDKKNELREKFSKAKVYFEEDQSESEQEKKDAEVDDLAGLLAGSSI